MVRPLIGAIDTPLRLLYFFARPKSPVIFPIPIPSLRQLNREVEEAVEAQILIECAIEQPADVLYMEQVLTEV